MAAFTGMLNSNEIFAGLFNMVLSQENFASNIADTKASLVDMSRVDGSMYGDTKLYYSTDALHSRAWGNDAEGPKLLQAARPSAPQCQAIVLDKFRIIELTTDEYMSKRAWGTEYAFSQFNSIMKGWISETKRIYDSTTFNAFLGTVESNVGKQEIEIDVTAAVGDKTGEEKARIEGQVIGENVALLLVNLTDVSRDYNDYGNIRSYYNDDLVFVWNSDAMAKIERRDLPTIYHKDIIDRFGEYTLPGRYFGTVNKVEKTGDGATIYSLVEQDLLGTDGKTYQLFAGELIPKVCKAPANTSYTKDSTILFKVMHKRSIPFMSGMEARGSFYNIQSVNTKDVLVWGHNTLEYLKNYPMITVRQK